MINAIDLTCLSYHLSGIERYALCITEEMLKQDKDNEYILVFRNEVYSELNPFIDGKHVRSIILRGNQKQLFQLFILPRKLKRIKADHYLFFANRNPLFFRKGEIFNTIHDLVCWDHPETTRLFQRIYSRIANRNAARVSKHIFTVSEYSKQRIHQILNFPLEKITVTYNGISDSLKKESNVPFETIKEKYHLPDKYIMNLSTLEPRKNLPLLLKCFDEISDKVDYDLVLVGRKGWKIEEFLQSIRSNNRIHVTGFVEDKEVIQIYKHALCFVFTSIYEGFGIPPIEALSLGTPVLSSDAASLPEVLRNQATFFVSNNKESLTNRLLCIEEEAKIMPRELDEYQRNNYDFTTSAKRVLKVIEKEE